MEDAVTISQIKRVGGDLLRCRGEADAFAAKIDLCPFDRFRRRIESVNQLRLKRRQHRPRSTKNKAIKGTEKTPAITVPEMPCLAEDTIATAPLPVHLFLLFAQPRYRLLTRQACHDTRWPWLV